MGQPSGPPCAPNEKRALLVTHQANHLSKTMSTNFVDRQDTKRKHTRGRTMVICARSSPDVLGSSSLGLHASFYCSCCLAIAGMNFGRIVAMANRAARLRCFQIWVFNGKSACHRDSSRHQGLSGSRIVLLELFHQALH
ncbi:hypothetical protein GQ607_009739 [Colletotrichum asianum]|uniref:Uncharacterized protein n=1 Tax=Colletotrichum asianum TaxID=702518 RepID=A0A8H3ZQZ4_9PEZI|nr:hypothetical protein GQ607_009739 [Colletotrichum asianum]